MDFRLRFLNPSGKTIENTALVIKSGLTGQVEKLSISVRVRQKIVQQQREAIVNLSNGQNKEADWSSMYLTWHFSWFLFYTLVIATIILLICLYHNLISRNRRAVQEAPTPYQNTHSISPYAQHTPILGYDRSFSPPSERRLNSGYSGPGGTPSSSRTMYSISQ